MSLALQKTFSAPNTDDYGGRVQKPIASVSAGVPLGFEPVAVRSTPVRVRVSRRSHYVCIFKIHSVGRLMAALSLLLAVFFGPMVMQISPAELGAIPVADAIGGLAAVAICALLLFQIVLTLRKLSA